MSNRQCIFLSLLAFFAGVLGAYVFSFFMDLMGNQNFFQIFQSIVLLLTIVVLFLTWRFMKNEEKNRVFNEYVNLYYSQDVYEGIRALWILYKECVKDIEKFKKRYDEIVGEQKDMKETTETLHYQRRNVLRFFRGLGLSLREKSLPQKRAFKFWSKENFDILDFLIPLTEHLHENIYEHKFPEDDPINYLMKMRHKFHQSTKAKE